MRDLVQESLHQIVLGNLTSSYLWHLTFFFYSMFSYYLVPLTAKCALDSKIIFFLNGAFTIASTQEKKTIVFPVHVEIVPLCPKKVANTTCFWKMTDSLHL